MDAHAEDRIGRRILPTFVRAAIYAGVWLPVLALISAFAPRFDELFVRLSERGELELPAVTEWLMLVIRLNNVLFFLPCLFAFGLLMAVDIGLAHCSRHSRRAESLYWVWFAGVILAGILVVNLVVVVLLLPVIRMSPAL